MSDENTPQEIEQALDDASEAVSVQASELQELVPGEGSDPIGLDSLMAVPVRVTVRLGSTRLTLSELVSLSPGSLIPLDREAHEPADILVNGKLIARGEIVTIDEKYGVRISSVEGSPV